MPNYLLKLSWTLQRSRNRNGWFGHLEVGIVGTEMVIERDGGSRTSSGMAEGVTGSNGIPCMKKFAMLEVTFRGVIEQGSRGFVPSKSTLSSKLESLANLELRGARASISNTDDRNQPKVFSKALIQAIEKVSIEMILSPSNGRCMGSVSRSFPSLVQQSS